MSIMETLRMDKNDFIRTFAILTHLEQSPDVKR